MRGQACSVEEFGGVATLPVSGCNEGREERGEFSGALLHPCPSSSLLLVLTNQVAWRDRVRCDPLRPAGRVLGGPVADVVVEGADGDQDGVRVFSLAADSLLSVDHEPQPVFPGAHDLVVETQSVDAWFVDLDVAPEQQHEFRRERCKAGVVEGCLALVEVVDQQGANRLRFDVVAVDEFGHGSLPNLRQRHRVARCIWAENVNLEE